MSMMANKNKGMIYNLRTGMQNIIDRFICCLVGPILLAAFFIWTSTVFLIRLRRIATTPVRVVAQLKYERFHWGLLNAFERLLLSLPFRDSDMARGIAKEAVRGFEVVHGI